MTVLVTYATKMGATASIAAAIGVELRAAGFTVDVHEIGAVQAVTPYEAVVVGSALYQGRWLPEAVHFLRRHTRQLRTRRVWLFHSGPLGPSRRQDQPVPADVARLARELGAPPVKTFAGNLQADDGIVRVLGTTGELERQRAESIAGSVAGVIAVHVP